MWLSCLPINPANHLVCFLHIGHRGITAHSWLHSCGNTATCDIIPAVLPQHLSPLPRYSRSPDYRAALCCLNWRLTVRTRQSCVCSSDTKGGQTWICRAVEYVLLFASSVLFYVNCRLVAAQFVCSGLHRPVIYGSNFFSNPDNGLIQGWLLFG